MTKSSTAPLRIENMPIDKLEPNRHQPRKTFNKEQMEELEESIKGVGLVDLILVASMDNGHYEIIKGHRRYEVLKKQGKKEIQVLVRDDGDEKRSALEAFVSNECRSNLDPFERAEAIRNIQKLHEISPSAHKETARLLGMSENLIKHALSFEKVPKVLRGTLPARKAIELTVLDDETEQVKAAEVVERHELSREETRTLVAAIRKSPEPLKRAILNDEVDPREAAERVEMLGDRQIPEDRVQPFVEEMKKRKKVKAGWKAIEHEEDERFLKKGADMKLEKRRPTKDEKEFERMYKAARLLGVNDPLNLHTLTNIENPRIHDRARRMLDGITEYLNEQLLYDQKNWPRKPKPELGESRVSEADSKDIQEQIE